MKKEENLEVSMEQIRTRVNVNVEDEPTDKDLVEKLNKLEERIKGNESDETLKV